MARSPYCNNCGYSLVGLTESSKCPECGRPLVEVLERGPTFGVGRRYTSPVVVFGLPLLQIALGPHDDERMGRARGIIAIGDVATGWLAIGGFARGIIAIGGFALGLVSIGGFSLGLLLAAGGFAVGGLAVGGGAMGGLAMGGGAAGFVAQGGAAVGYYANGGGAWGVHVQGPSRSDPEAVRVFERLNELLGGGPQAGIRWLLAVHAWFLVLTGGVALLCALVVLLGYYAAQRGAPPG